MDGNLDKDAGYEYTERHKKGYIWDYWGLKHNRRYWSWKDTMSNSGREGLFEYRLIKNQLQYRKLYPDQKPDQWRYVWNLEYWQSCFKRVPV
jgi:hypothetical protein